MHVVWSVKAAVKRWGKLSCALQVLFGCSPAALRAFAAPVLLSTCSTFCCPSVSYWQRLCRLSVCQLYLKAKPEENVCVTEQVEVFLKYYTVEAGDWALQVPAFWLVPVSSVAFDTLFILLLCPCCKLILTREEFFSHAGLGWSEDLTIKHIEFGSLGPYLCLDVYFWHDQKSSMSVCGGRGKGSKEKQVHSSLCLHF